MRAREGFRFWGQIDYCGKMWKPLHYTPSIKATSRGGSYVTKCNPAPAPLWAFTGGRSISSEGPNLPTHTYIYTYDLLDEGLAHMVSDMVETNTPTNFYVDASFWHGTIHYNLNHTLLS